MRHVGAFTRSATCALLTLCFLGGAVATAQAGPNGWKTGAEKKPCLPCLTIGSFKTVFRSGYAIVECERDYKEYNKPWVYVNCKVVAWIVNPNEKRAGEACTSPGAEQGEIVIGTPTLSFAAISGSGTAEPVVGLEVSLKTFAFDCGTTKFEAKGGIIGAVTPIREPTTEYTATFTENEGVQIPTKFEGGKPVSLTFKATEGKAKGKWKPGTVESTEQLTTEQPSELKSDQEWKEKIKEEKSKKTSKVPKWWVGGKLFDAGTEPLAEETTVTAPLKLQLTFKKGEGSGFTIECAKVKLKNAQIEGPSSRSEEAQVYEDCVVVGQPGCSARSISEPKGSETIATEPLSATLEGTVGHIKLKFKPKSGGRIAAYYVEGTCNPGEEGNYEADGDMICGYPNVETEEPEHLLEFTVASKSKVKVTGASKTVFTVTFADHLASEKLYSAF